MARQKNTGKRIRNREVVQQALELRKAGASFEQIGNKLGFTKQRAFTIVSEALAELNETCAHESEVVRRLELERLDGILLSLWPQRGNPRVADTILRTMERRSKLLGLDAPDKIAPTTPDGAEPYESNRPSLDALPMELVRQLRDHMKTSQRTEG